MKKIFTLGLSVLFSVFAFSKSVDLLTAQKVAENYFKHYTNAHDATLMQDHFYTDATQNFSFYVFDFAPTGFIIVSADDRCLPIIGYSNECNYTEPLAGTAIKNWLDGRATEIQYVVKNNLPADDNINQQWMNGINNSIARAKSGSSISPLLGSIKWDQGNYYNYYCPTDASSVIGNGKVPTGCVATAMAQIMKYWNYPSVGNGSHSYTASGYGSQSANFGTTHYDFKSMKNTANSTSYTQIARLIYHCGVAINMGFGPTGSGAQMIGGGNSALNAFKNYFRYNSTKIKGYAQSSYTNTQWINMIEAELKLHRPIQYDGYDPSNEGHSWVCDGFDTNDNLHMNWGWGGTDNGFYAVGSLNPPSLGTGGGSGGGFNAGDGIIMGIEPLGDPYEGTNGNNKYSTAYKVPLNFVNDTVSFVTNYASFHTITDTDYYQFSLPAGYDYSITNSAVFDKYYMQAVGNFNEDAQCMYTTDSANWIGIFDDVINDFSMSCGGELMFKVFPFLATDMGTYQLNVHLSRTAKSCTTGIDNIAENKINIFPNPASDKVIIISSLPVQTIQIVDVMGRLLLSKTFDGRSMLSSTIDTKEFGNGIYFIQIKTSSQNITQKIIVQH